jgi:hypothetical protein
MSAVRGRRRQCRGTRLRGLGCGTSMVWGVWWAAENNEGLKTLSARGTKLHAWSSHEGVDWRIGRTVSGLGRRVRRSELDAGCCQRQAAAWRWGEGEITVKAVWRRHAGDSRDPTRTAIGEAVSVQCGKTSNDEGDYADELCRQQRRA